MGNIADDDAQSQRRDNEMTLSSLSPSATLLGLGQCSFDFTINDATARRRLPRSFPAAAVIAGASTPCRRAAFHHSHIYKARGLF